MMDNLSLKDSTRKCNHITFEESSNSSGLISIIMAAYNAEKTINSAIQSVLTQTYENWELIVIDDCSKDRTVQIVTSIVDPRIRVLRNERNSGVSLSRKKGMDAAKGAWIAVLDSDDMWTPDKLQRQIDLADETGANLVFTGSAFIKDDGSPLDWQLHVPSLLTYRELLKQNLISNSSVLVKTDLYRKYYAIGDKMHEDFAIWLAITREGEIAYGIDEPLLVYRLAKSSKSSNKLRAAKMNWNTYRYIGLSTIESFYYMFWYVINGILKYQHLS